MNKSKNTITIVLIAVSAVLFILRFVRLGIDPPYFFAGITQAHLTDPYHLTMFARNAVLFDDWNPFDYHRWDVFKYSLVSGTSYIMFLIFGVSRITANISGLILNLAGMALFVLGFRNYRPTRETMFTAVFLLLSSMLVFYGRLPFLENGLIALSGLTFYIFALHHDKRWGQFTVGFIIALAALSGKLFGFILLGPVIITYLYIHRSRMVVPSLITIGGTIVGVIAYILVFYGGSLSVMQKYFTEQTVGLYGTPTAFVSLSMFLAKIPTLGCEAGFFRMTPFITSLGVLGALVFVLKNQIAKKIDQDLIPILFCAAWLVCGLFGLMPFNYRPLRYQIFLLLPIASMAGYLVYHIFDEPIRISIRNKTITVIPAIFLSVWFLATQIWVLGTPQAESFAVGVRIAPLTAAIALIVTAIVWIFLRGKRRELSKRGLILVLIPLILGACVIQANLLYNGLALPGYELRRINSELAEIVDDNAVITGPYAPAFTIDNKLKALIHVFGLSVVDRHLFDKFPITHIVADRSNWDLAVEQYPPLKSSLNLRRIRIRDGSVEIFRVPGRSLPFTDYETAAAAFGKKQYDSAYVYSRRFSVNHADNLFGQFGRIIALMVFGDNNLVHTELQKLAARYPDNFRVHMFCRDSYRLMHEHSQDANFLRLKDYHYNRAREINPAYKK